ncbi:hypothetical protein BH11PLA1_BH11PLA1_15120 [soil metagenome]
MNIDPVQPPVPAPDACACTGGKQCPLVSLCAMKPGQAGVIAEAHMGEADASLLRAMGLAPGSRVMLCRSGEPCIVALLAGVRGGADGDAGRSLAERCACASRIGLARPLAERIMVTPA